jgi:hypothetical protein
MSIDDQTREDLRFAARCIRSVLDDETAPWKGQCISLINAARLCKQAAVAIEKEGKDV